MSLVVYLKVVSWGPFSLSFTLMTYQSIAVIFTFMQMILSWGLSAGCWGLSAGYQPRPQVVDRGTTARYGGQLRYI